MIKKIIFVTLVCMISVQLFSDSVFSFKGIPETFSGRDIIGAGMGDTGIGNLLRANSSLSNPALSVNSYYTTFSTAFSLGNIKTTDNQSNQSYSGDQSYFPYFNLSIPIYQHRIGVAYNSIGIGEFSSEAQANGNFGYFTEISKADKSLYEGDIFYANKNDLMNFGISFSYIFGHAINYYKADFDSTDLTDTIYEIEETFKNPRLTLGIAKEITKDFSYGATFTLPVKLKGTKQVKSVLTQNLPDITHELPAKFSIGTAYRFTEHLNLAMDFDYELWSNVNTYNKAENTMRFGIGTEFEGFEKSKHYLYSIPQRIGFMYKETPLDAVNNQSHKIQEIAGTYGFSLPIKTKDAHLDFALKIFNRSSTQTDFEESGFLLSIGTVGFDIFKRPLDRKAARDIPKADDK